MLLSKGAEPIRKMNSETAGNLTAHISTKQVKLLYRISKLKQLMDDAVHVLVEEVNSRGIFTYQEETERESNTAHTEVKTIHNLTTNLISEERLPTIPKEIQEVIDRYLKVISKGEWDIGYTDLIEHEIHLEYDRLIKRSVRYVNLRLADWLKKELKRMEAMQVIQKSCSPYASPITIVEVEKADGTTKIRLCSDITDLNEVTIKDARLISYQQTVFDRMGGAKWFSNF